MKNNDDDDDDARARARGDETFDLMQVVRGGFTIAGACVIVHESGSFRQDEPPPRVCRSLSLDRVIIILYAVYVTRSFTVSAVMRPGEHEV